MVSMDYVHARVFGLEVLPGSASDAMDGYLRDNQVISHLHEDDGDDWDASGGPTDPHVNVWASLRRDFDAIHELCLSANVAVPEDGSDLFGLSLQNPNAISELDSAMAAKTREIFLGRRLPRYLS